MNKLVVALAVTASLSAHAYESTNWYQTGKNDAFVKVTNVQSAMKESRIDGDGTLLGEASSAMIQANQLASKTRSYYVYLSSGNLRFYREHVRCYEGMQHADSISVGGRQLDVDYGYCGDAGYGVALTPEDNLVAIDMFKRANAVTVNFDGVPFDVSAMGFTKAYNNQYANIKERKEKFQRIQNAKKWSASDWQYGDNGSFEYATTDVTNANGKTYEFVVLQTKDYDWGMIIAQKADTEECKEAIGAWGNEASVQVSVSGRNVSLSGSIACGQDNQQFRTTDDDVDYVINRGMIGRETKFSVSGSDPIPVSFSKLDMTKFSTKRDIHPLMELLGL